MVYTSTALDMDSVIRGHQPSIQIYMETSLIELLVRTSQTALFAASVAELGIECARGLSGSSRTLSISYLESSICLKYLRSAITVKLLVIK